MSRLDLIKQNILQMSAGEFQGLCDAYLSKSGYDFSVGLGTESGTRKTTKGTPDTYFVMPNGSFVFVEYTTQLNGLVAKIKADINKCLDVESTGITYDKISEIIYCHTSSNIAPKDYNEFTEMCENVGIKFTMIGIDKLALDLYNNHRGLVKEILHIAIDTDQIKDIDRFVSEYNKNRMAAPVDTEFFFREKEQNAIETAFKENDVVILCGSAGTGKTRLALHYSKNHSKNNDEHLYCIHNNGFHIYEDLPLYIDKPGKYFLMIDDANQLSGLEHVIKYAMKQDEGFQVKILITVRDYAIQKVEDELKQFVNYKKIVIKPFSDDEIKQLLKNLLDIHNEHYLERIIKISEGNARIAMLAGKIACDSNRLDSINDVSQLYENYYSPILNDNEFSSNDKLLISAGVIAFLESLHLDHIEPVVSLLNSIGISKEDFTENIYFLHEREIVDICHNKAVKFSEQCLGNFLLKYVFFDKRKISLSEMVKTCFEKYSNRTISSVSTLVNFFHNEQIVEFVESEIKTLWYDLEKEKSPLFFKFVKAFYPINPTETLLLLNREIESIAPINIDIDTIDINKRKNYQSVSDDILIIIGGFADTDDLETALDLYFQYYLRRPDLFIQFYHTANAFFGFNLNYIEMDCYTQKALFKKFFNYSQNWTNHFVNKLFLEVAESFLKLNVEFTENRRRGNTVNFCSFFLTLTDGTKEYRNIIWNALAELSKTERYHKKVSSLISAYDNINNDVCIPVVKNDIIEIKKIIKNTFNSDDFDDCMVVRKIERLYDNTPYNYEEDYKNFLENPKMKIYNILIGPAYDEDFNYERRQAKRREQVKMYVSSCDINSFKNIIDICCEITDEYEKWEMTDSLEEAFCVFLEKSDNFTEIIKCYFQKNTPLNIPSNKILQFLLSKLSENEIYEIIKSCNFDEQNHWEYCFYYKISESGATKEKLDKLYLFLQDNSDSKLKTSPRRDVTFIERYNAVDENAFVNCCRMIFNKANYSPFMVVTYFSMLFNDHFYTTEKVLDLFKGDVSLLSNIYLYLVENDRHCDYNGSFLKAICSVDSSIAVSYFEKVFKLKSNVSVLDFSERNTAFFELENAIEIYDSVLDVLLKNSKYSPYDILSIVETIVTPQEKKSELLSQQDLWIKHTIEMYSTDRERMKCLFGAISKLKRTRRLEYIKFFLDHNQDYNSFENIPLLPLSVSWSGSAIPMYTSQIEFLQSILQNLTGLKFIKHKERVINLIEESKQSIKAEQIDELLNG